MKMSAAAAAQIYFSIASYHYFYDLLNFKFSRGSGQIRFARANNTCLVPKVKVQSLAADVAEVSILSFASHPYFQCVYI